MILQYKNFLLISCSEEYQKPSNTSNPEQVKTIIKDTLSVDDAMLKIQVRGGKRTYKDSLFTGYGTKKYNNNQISEKILYINGKKEGIAKYWFEDGTLKKTKQFSNNKLNGKIIVYFKGGQTASIKNYKNNILEGVQETWYRDGQIFKRQNYVNGKENGLQESWMKNGKKFINYEARNGRIFGLKRMNLCFGLKNEDIKKDK